MLIDGENVKFTITELDAVRKTLLERDTGELWARIREAQDDWCANYAERHPNFIAPDTVLGQISLARATVRYDAFGADPMKKSEALSEHIVIPMTQDELKTFGFLLASWLKEEMVREVEEGDVSKQALANYAETLAMNSLYDTEDHDLGPEDEASFIEFETQAKRRTLQAGKAMMLTIFAHFGDDGQPT